MVFQLIKRKAYAHITAEVASLKRVKPQCINV